MAGPLGATLRAWLDARSKPKEPRSPEWPTARRHWLAGHPTCAACGERARLEVHHVKPFHLYPQLELDPTNFITLGEACLEANHHLQLGHHGNWRDENPHVRADAAARLAVLRPGS